MTVEAKICGLDTPAAVGAALAGGAGAIGLVFYPPSPRSLAPETAAALAEMAQGVTRVGLFVDPSDAELEQTLGAVPLEMLQLHGAETPERVAAIKRRFGLPAMKAIKIAGPEDLRQTRAYQGAADWLLFDAKAPAEMTDALPGGNGVMFDWRILAGRQWTGPWMLSGGLGPDNVGEAVAVTGAAWVDVSSGVEDAPGKKNVALIAAFLDAVRRI